MIRVPRLASALAAIGLAVGLSLAGAGTARADVTPPQTWIPIHNPYLHAKINTLCFEDPNSSTANGMPVQLGHCHGYASDGGLQRWVFVEADDLNSNPIVDNGSPVYEVYSLTAERCLDEAAMGSSPYLGSCILSDSANPLWELRTVNSPAGTGPDFLLTAYIHLYNACVAANDFSDNIPTRLVMAPCNASDTRQLWNLG